MDPHNEKDTDQVSSTFSNMPTDIIANILGRLPLEPLVKSRLVCREWQCVSSRKDFIEDYDKRLNLGGPPTFHCLVTASTKYIRDVGCYSVLLDPERSRGDSITDALISSFYHIPENSTFESTRPKTAALVSRFYHQIPEDSKFNSDVGSQAIDRLVCIYCTTPKFYYVYVVNPLTREQIAIPPGPPQHFKQGNIIKPIKSDINFNFGYDPVGEEYKVLQMQLLEELKCPHSVKFGRLECEVLNFKLLIYTLGTENWRQIHLAIPESVHDENHLCSFLENKPLCLNGKLYWPSYDYRTSCILVFEVRSEMFTTIPLPELHGPCDNRWDFYAFDCKLIEMDGCLGLLGELRERREIIGLWILRNNAWEMLHDNYLKTSFVLSSNMREILGTLPTTITTWLLMTNYPIKMSGYINICMLDLNSQTQQPAVAFLPNEMEDRYSRLRSLSRYVPSIMPIPSKWKFSYRQVIISSEVTKLNPMTQIWFSQVYFFYSLFFSSLSQCLRLLRTTETAMLPAMNMEGESLLLRPL